MVSAVLCSLIWSVKLQFVSQRVTPMLSNPLAAAFVAMLFQYVDQFAARDGGMIPHDLERRRIVAVRVWPRTCRVAGFDSSKHPSPPLNPA